MRTFDIARAPRPAHRWRRAAAMLLVTGLTAGAAYAVPAFAASRSRFISIGGVMNFTKWETGETCSKSFIDNRLTISKLKSIKYTTSCIGITGELFFTIVPTEADHIEVRGWNRVALVKNSLELDSAGFQTTVGDNSSVEIGPDPQGFPPATIEFHSMVINETGPPWVSRRYPMPSVSLSS